MNFAIIDPAEKLCYSKDPGVANFRDVFEKECMRASGPRIGLFCS